jgi:hypothetical protein
MVNTKDMPKMMANPGKEALPVLMAGTTSPRTSDIKNDRIMR